MKRALAMSVFGGCSKNVDGKHCVRGDVNVLLVGDPGCAKSQLLKYCCGVVSRAVYTTGKGASAVGLTAGVHRDPVSKEWTLEGGALVLADNGMCCIDEFDKMNEQDRTSIHEAMEQQTISISKAGIVTSLQARCSIVAAANPIGGQYDPSATFSENIELTDPIIQRFDILCILQDVVDPLRDDQLGNFVIESHQNAQSMRGKMPQRGRADTKAALGHDSEDCTNAISQSNLRKYVAHARATCRPKLHAIDQNKVSCLYAELRRESANCGGIPIAVRHLESLMRMAEAQAKMSLREHVCDDDVNAAITMLIASFINAQKNSVRSSLERGFRKYLVYRSDFFDLLLHALRSLIREAQIYSSLRTNRSPGLLTCRELEVLVTDFEAKAHEFNYQGNLEEFYTSEVFSNQGFRLDHREQVILWSPPGNQ